MKFFRLSIMLLVIVFSSAAFGAKLTVNSDGQLLLDGQLYRGVGINFFGAFYDTVIPTAKPTYHKDFKYLVDNGVPFIRFAATPFWPVHFDLYLNDREEYFKRMDALVARAEEVGLGLIPSLFWHQSAISDLCDEPRRAWGRADSKTSKFMARYTREFINRYKNSPAIWAWEFGNEYNLPVDLPNAKNYRPKVNLKMGTRKTRSEADDIRGAEFVSSVRRFAEIARKLDGERAIISGNSIPRVYAWHNWKENSWTIDTPEQFTFMLGRDNPDPVNTLSVHIYPRKDGRERYFEARLDKYDMIDQCMASSKELKKPLFIGEYGSNMAVWGDQQRQVIEKLTDRIVKAEVPLAAFWVWSLNWQEPTFSVTADNQRSYVLKIIAEANKAHSENLQKNKD